MPEYTDLYCFSSDVARSVADYLHDELYSIEESERPEINAYVEKSTLRIEYGNDAASHRREWDMQLKGYRDGYQTAMPAV